MLYLQCSGEVVWKSGAGALSSPNWFYAAQVFQGKYTYTVCLELKMELWYFQAVSSDVGAPYCSMPMM